ncbi:AraC family transcriptional regulator [Flavobacterium sp. F-65]|uniref:AraC family transcriptional regulator n=1 Tax=Flavobacterium pisciphilum TaxID=2893755 RepID=A0ABS8MNL4_9FLAO|nr:AraC family transcriptional regulator [Flavobacterium sp. F-65]
MERFIQHTPLFIRHFTTETWPFPVHNHNHFELVFIHSGNGLHQLNGGEVTYKGPCIFLLCPSDYHLFIIDKETEFSVLKFNNRYLDGTSSDTAKNEWNKVLDQLLGISNTQDGKLVDSAQELDKINHLMRLIVSEWDGGSKNGSHEVLLYLIRSVFAVIKKNAFQSLGTNAILNEGLLVGIMNYIHKEIRVPTNLNLMVLSTHFNMAPNHLSSLFKRQTGGSIKKYIDDYKYKLIENRLKHSAVLMKEISNEFGFSDVSHFNKFLKKQTGLNPKDVRKMYNVRSEM